jgi:acyl dehydratase
LGETRAVGLFVEDFQVGQKITTRGRTIGEGDVHLFAGLVGDFTPIHVDEEYSSKTRFGSRIAHGTLVMSMAIGQFSQMGVLDEGVIALLGLDFQFKGVVKLGDTITAHVTIKEARLSKSQKGAGVVAFAFDIVNQRGETVETGVMTVLMKARNGAQA